LDQATNSFTLLNLFYDGGGWMYPLLLCSLFAVGVIIAKAFALWAAHRESKTILEDVETLIHAGKVNEAVVRCEETPGPVAAILLAGLRRVQEEDYRTNDVEQAVKTTGTIELGFLERGLPILATISNVAPLLGFLGTVAGMISAFAAIEIAGQVEATLVAGGIKVALITTATGLLIAVPVNISYNFFVTRIDKLIVDMEQGAAKILALVWELADRRAAAARI
jgi:biopolymer transport protein ExbB